MNKRKVKQFIDNNFPPCCDYTIIEDKEDKVIALLDYGRREDKLKIAIGYSDEGNMCKLLSTDFVR